MGRSKKNPEFDRSAGGMSASKAAAERLREVNGLSKQVCTSCNVRNPANADKCRKCGHTNLRPKASDFRDA